ncbi:MAG TPA: site-2 protease family protein [Thermoanaerobaculia bacterium]|nr:site-2 protease family protein [Thermoanaerobaculia bacterium]
MLHLGSIGKTSIDVDFSFFMLLGLFVILNYDESRGIEYALIWIPILFLSVLIHELAHAAAIAIFGFGASSIILGGMGGLTANEHMRNARPWQGFVISVAGPVSSFVLWFLASMAMGLPIARTDRFFAVFLPLFALANAWWGIFNLIPVPPLDGGHATRDFFRMFLDERKAFIIAIWIAIIVGGAVTILGLINRQLFLTIYIGWFSYMSWQRWQYFREHGIPGD